MTRRTARRKLKGRPVSTGIFAWYRNGTPLYVLLFGVIFIATGMALFARHIPFFSPLLVPLSRRESESILFVGDVMLARNVERLMRTEGAYYPFKGIQDMLESYEAVVGNFEGSIPQEHIPTSPFSFRFSVDADTIPVLSRAGFTDLLLANNHSYDSGRKGYDNTRGALTDAGLAVGGNPKTVTDDEVLYHMVSGARVAIIPVNTIFTTPPLADITGVLTRTAEKSALQIVFIHWGDEYETVANDSQRTLTRTLIDAGADAIIGHHPHVVQDVEEYRGAPIFYSLGNFIFDQYWNDDVQVGLTVALAIVDDEVRYMLMPVTSRDTKSAPRPMNRFERMQFLDALASRSEATLATAIKDGAITEIFAGSNTDY